MRKRLRKKLADSEKRAAQEAFAELADIWRIDADDRKALLAGESTHKICLLIVIYDCLLCLYGDSNSNVDSWWRRPWGAFATARDAVFFEPSIAEAMVWDMRSRCHGQ